MSNREAEAPIDKLLMTALTEIQDLPKNQPYWGKKVINIMGKVYRAGQKNPIPMEPGHVVAVRLIPSQIEKNVEEEE